MANKIQVRRGIRAHLPVLSVGEFGFCTDTKELFVGSDSGNIAIANLEHEHEFTHDHDERYYTKSATNNLLNEKANINHNHTKSDITDFAHTHSEYLTELPSHNHDGRYNTKSEITTALAGKSDINHVHTISNVTNLQSSLNGKSDVGHVHSVEDISDMPEIPSISIGTSHNNADIWYKEV